MTLKNLYIVLMAIATGATSCRKFVEVEQPNQRVFRYTSDYQRLLSDRTVFEITARLPMLSSDDISLDANPTTQNLLNNGSDSVYIWGASYYPADQSDVAWDQLYNQVYTCNLIISDVLNSEGGTAVQQQNAWAEAKVQRAYTYLTLVNLYARPYNEATASTDPGLPLLLAPDLFVNLQRVAVKAVYDQVIKDLTEALPSLPDQPSNNIHAAKAAGYATLARTYLYMRRFPEAAAQAALALGYQRTVLDLRTYANNTPFPRRLNNPEVILAKQVAMPGDLNLPLSDELLQKFQANDLRYELYTRNGSTFQPAFTDRGSWRARLFAGDNVTTGITVPEVMLIQAEGLARNGQGNEAMAIINDLRQKRFRTADYVALSAANSDAALRMVLDERKRELFGTGLRWFDQRRLSLESAFAETETRLFKGNTYTLVPGNRYVYPIPPKNIDLNPELTQNQR